MYKETYTQKLYKYNAEMFEAVRYASEPLSKVLRRELTNGEVSAVVIYFLDYLERMDLCKEVKRVLLLGFEEENTLALAIKRLKLLFNIELIDQKGDYEMDD